jgi:hypothetical protein
MLQILFMKLGILYIFQVNSLYIARFMFCYHNEILPPVFHNMFQCNNARSANNLYRPRANLKKIYLTFIVAQ